LQAFFRPEKCCAIAATLPFGLVWPHSLTAQGIHFMGKQDSTSTGARIVGALAGLAAAFAFYGLVRERAEPPAMPAPVRVIAVPVPAPSVRSKEQAMAALMALPELKAWSSRLEKRSGGKVHGALIEYDPKPKLINGKGYWQLSFVENGTDAAHSWESFLVSQSTDEILVEDFESDKVLSLEQWRKQHHPMERTSFDTTGG
jgi:hypothetical protein